MTSTAQAAPYDVILLGASGFTGRLTAEFLARHHSDGSLRWAIAGRNREKLAQVSSELAALGAADVPILLADSGDRASLDAIAGSARVVCTTVGPYARYGSDLVAACVAAGTAYCDLTGEVQWVRRMIDAHHVAAQQSGARIVHCCGFDSIPSDLGAQLVVEEAQRRHGRTPDTITLYVGATRGGFSGGTVASMLNVLEEAGDRSVRRVLGNPYSLCPDGERSGPDGSDLMSLEYDRAESAWVAPFLMASVNSRVVRRSNALLGYAYGRDLRYREVTRTGGGMGGMFKGGALVAGLGGFVTVAAVGPLRRGLLPKVLPAPGEGPTREQIDNGFFRLDVVGRWADGTPDVRVQVRGRLDPGYGATAAMLAESALCLAQDAPSDGGVLTPASAMGRTLRERLNARGVVTFAAE